MMLRTRRALSRALRRRCPACGGRPIFVGWKTLCPNCPVCGLDLSRGRDGYWLGAYITTLIMAVTLFHANVWVLVLWSAPPPPWNLILAWGPLLALAVPLGLYPVVKNVYLACDILLRPPTEADFPAPREPSPTASKAKQVSHSP